jgi:hypothetical protein
MHHAELLGALSITKKRGDAFTPAEDKLVGNLAAQAGLVLRNVGLTEQLIAKLAELRTSRERLVTPRTGNASVWNATSTTARSGSWLAWPASSSWRPRRWSTTRLRRKRC